MGKAQTKAIADVLNERERQMQVEGWSIEHDDKYELNELTRAAAGYTNNVVARGWTFPKDPEGYQQEEVPDFWPWDDAHWKPKSPRQDLVRATALLIAEIERIDRKAEKEKDIV